MPQEFNVQGFPVILDRIVASRELLAVAALVLLVAVWAGMILVRSVIHSAESVLKSLLYFFRTIFREVLGGADIRPHERINGIAVLGCLLLTTFFVVLFALPTIRTSLFGDAPPWPFLAGFLGCLAITGGTAVLCARACSKHDLDVRNVKSYKARRP